MKNPLFAKGLSLDNLDPELKKKQEGLRDEVQKNREELLDMINRLQYENKNKTSFNEIQKIKGGSKL